jgi:hypothetical protein
MTTLLFLFALLTAPTDKYICELWTRALTRDGLIQACGTTQLAGYRVDVYDLSLRSVCQQDAALLNDMQELMRECNMNAPLDEYILRIVQPGFTELMCSVISAQKKLPTLDEVADQCPEGLTRFKTGAYSIAWKAEYIPPEQTRLSCPARELITGQGLYEQAFSPESLMTDASLPWLAGKLIWNNVISVDSCQGSGLDPLTLAANPCGLTHAKSFVYQWQNQFNPEIYSAALAYHVPARLLKRMMMTESQLWPFYNGKAGEISIMQVTDNGLDTLLRFDPAIDPTYLSRTDQGRQWSRGATRQIFTCLNCSLEDAVTHIKQTMPYYARLLAAFHCRAVTINPALTGADTWRQAVVDYNGSAEYLRRIEQ